MRNVKKYPISFWNTTGFNKMPAEKIKDWVDLGITLAMAPCDLDNKHLVYELLDLANKNDIKIILCDPRADWKVYMEKGEEKYREGMKDAIKDFGSHPAMFGFFVGDEPDLNESEAAFSSTRINNEMAPHLTAYINLLPWFDWIGDMIGEKSYAEYIDKFVEKTKTKLVSYDCYAQMREGTSGYNDYFNNLYQHYLASKRNDTEFISIVLSCGHWDYRCPSKDDMLWQLTTSVAHGASGVSWFFIELPDILVDARNAPINQLGDRTEQFGWLREVNCVFNNYCGEIISKLTIDKCFHFGESYGGVPEFKQLGPIKKISSSTNTPLIVSEFHNEEGEKFYIVCNNSPEKVTRVSVYVDDNVAMSGSVYGNKFEEIIPSSDFDTVRGADREKAIRFDLAPGQLKVLKEKK